MEIEFDKEYLEELYSNGKCKDKKHRYQPSVVNQYVKTVNTLKSAQNTETLYKLKSLNYEKMSGNKKDIESVRINDQYRLEFKSRIEKKNEKSITICALTELSNHYKK